MFTTKAAGRNSKAEEIKLPVALYFQPWRKATKFEYFTVKLGQCADLAQLIFGSKNTKAAGFITVWVGLRV